VGAAQNLGKNADSKADASNALVLIAEDSSLNGEIERNYFSSVGFDTKLATTPQQVESILASENVDVLIVDVGFAGDKGLSMVKVASRVSQNPNLRILVTSVRQTPEIRRKVVESGAHAFVSKPSPRPVLLKEVKKLGKQAARTSERVHEQLQVTASFESLNWSFDGVSLDVSSEGIHIQYGSHLSRSKPALGTNVSVTLHFKSEKPLVVAGNVVRHTPEGLGVKFEELNKTVQRALDKFLLKHSIEHKASHFYL
jgi:DNA-binding response OmpR family regulator